jgi:hypothetical protein
VVCDHRLSSNGNARLLEDGRPTDIDHRYRNASLPAIYEDFLHLCDHSDITLIAYRRGAETNAGGSEIQGISGWLMLGVLLAVLIGAVAGLIMTAKALNLATAYPYDAHEDGQQSLRSSAGEIADQLRHEIADRLAKAGVEVIEARISHLAYAPEIANAMLRRQQASAIIAARAKMVEGAVGMVENALELISQKSLVALDDERKAAMVSNLLVVLCSDRDAQPIVNTGTIYQ